MNSKDPVCKFPPYTRVREYMIMNLLSYIYNHINNNTIIIVLYNRDINIFVAIFLL